MLRRFWDKYGAILALGFVILLWMVGLALVVSTVQGRHWHPMWRGHYEPFSFFICAIRTVAQSTWQWAADHFTIISTTLTAVATAVIAWFTRTLYNATKQQAQLTREIVELGNKEFIATHRPQLRLRYAVGELPPAGNFATAELHVANVGQSDAVIQQIGVDIFVRRTNVPNSGVFNAAPQPWSDSSSIPPGKEARMDAKSARPINANERPHIVTGGFQLCLLGIVNYVDRNQIVRSTSFFRIYNPNTKRFLRAAKDDQYAEWDYED